MTSKQCTKGFFRRNYPCRYGFSCYQIGSKRRHVWNVALFEECCSAVLIFGLLRRNLPWSLLFNLTMTFCSKNLPPRNYENDPSTKKCVWTLAQSSKQKKTGIAATEMGSKVALNTLYLLKDVDTNTLAFQKKQTQQFCAIIIQYCWQRNNLVAAPNSLHSISIPDFRDTSHHNLE